MGKEGESSESLPATAKAAGAPSNGRKTPNLPDIPPTEDEDDGKGKATKTTKAATPPPTYTAPPEDDFDALTKRFEALKKR